MLFLFDFFNRLEKSFHSAQHFCPAMTSTPPRSDFLPMPGFPKQKNVYFTINQKCYLYISSFGHGKSLLPSILSSTLLKGRRGWFGRASKGFRKPKSTLFLGRVEDARSRKVSVSVIEKGGVLRPSSRRPSVLSVVSIAPRAVASIQGAPKKGQKVGILCVGLRIKTICWYVLPARARALSFFLLSMLSPTSIVKYINMLPYAKVRKKPSICEKKTVNL